MKPPITKFDTLLEAIEFYAYRRMPASDNKECIYSLLPKGGFESWFSSPIRFALNFKDYMLEPCEVSLDIYEDMGCTSYILVFYLYNRSDIYDKHKEITYSKE